MPSNPEFLYPQETLDFLWAEAKASEICGKEQIAAHLRAAVTAMEVHNSVTNAPLSVKLGWRIKAQEQKTIPSTKLEDLL